MVRMGKSAAVTSETMGSSAVEGILTFPRSTASRTSMSAGSGSKSAENSTTRVAEPSAA